MPHSDYLNPIFYIKRGDTSPALEVLLRDAYNNPIVLGGATVRFIMALPGQAPIINRVSTVVDAANSQVRHTWLAGDTSVAGDYVAEFQVTFTSGAVQTFPNNRHIAVHIYPDIA